MARRQIEATAAELYINAILHCLIACGADVVGKGRSEFIWPPDYDASAGGEPEVFPLGV